MLINTVCLAVIVVFAACSKQPVTGFFDKTSPECLILNGQVKGKDSISVLLPGTVEAIHAPWPRNSGERLLFDHLYETLITVDCRGQVKAGLAESWSRGDGGRRWIFTVRGGAQFWDSTSVTAGDILESWQYPLVEEAAVIAGIESTTVTGDRVVTVYLSQARRRVPRVLASREFAVAKWCPGTHWPLGTGPYRVDHMKHRLPVSSGIAARPATGSGSPVIQFVEASTFDTRDLLEGQLDVLTTADPAVLEYAESRPHLVTAALPWEKTYVLLSTSRVRTLRGGGKVRTLPPDLLAGLAQDAVRGDARGYHPPSWWENTRSCGELSPMVPGIPSILRGTYPTSGFHHIVYDLDDPVARDLAERIVALAGTDPATSREAADLASAVPGLLGTENRTIAEGVTQDKFALSLRNGEDFAYVVAVPGQPLDPCYEIRKLLNRARWLVYSGSDLARSLIPLVDTRRHVIADSSRVGLLRDSVGGILITNGLIEER